MWSDLLLISPVLTLPALKLRGSPFIWCIIFIATCIHTIGIAAHSNIPTLVKDVAIIGGGASGTYAAVRLREDYGKDIVVIEAEGILGGHTNTYTDPVTSTALNYRVLAYIDYSEAKDFFRRFNITLQPYVQFNSTTIIVNPDSGKAVTHATTTSSFNSTMTAITKYLSIIKPWDNMLLPGYWDFPVGSKIPKDLLLPWAKFLDKYSLQALAPALQLVAGISTTSTIPALFNIMNFGTPAALGYLQNTYFVPRPFNNSLLYGKAKELLAHNLMLSSIVLHGDRSNDGTRLLVQNQKTGVRTIVKAKSLLFTAQPSLLNLMPLLPDKQEEAVFSTFSTSTLYTATVQTNILPDNTSIQFVPSSGDVQSYSLEINWNGEPCFFSIIFTSIRSQLYTPAQARQAILESFKILADGGEFLQPEDDEPSYEIVAFADHSGVFYNQTVEHLRAGFMQQLYALQGHRGTWYTGQTWCPGFSSNVWAFTDTVLPKLLSGLENDGVQSSP